MTSAKPATQPAVTITAMGHYHPPHLVENAFFDKLEIDSDAHWVVERTGIESRASVLTKDEIIALRYGRTTVAEIRAKGQFESIADFGAKAWENLRSRFTNVDLASIDTLICGTSVPDFDIPANASTIAARIGLQGLSFDTNSACSSFVTDLHVARGLLTSGLQKKVAVVNPERYSLRLNYSDRASCILFGDGCAMALCETDPKARGLRVLDTLVVSDPSGCEMITIGVDQAFQQNGRAVQKFAITKTVDVAREIVERNNFQLTDLSYFVGHQANLRMVSSAAERLGLQPHQHLFNVDRLGNQGAAGAPAVLSGHWQQFKTGDLIVVAVVGSGLTWGAALLQFQ